MSQWTHVCGCIRYDHIRALLPPPNFTQLLGRQSGFEDDFEPEDIPSGSEGSIRYRVIENESESSLAAYTVAIWGDLRDFGEESVQLIRDWFDRITKGSLCVREAVLVIDVEYGETHVLRRPEEVPE